MPAKKAPRRPPTRKSTAPRPRKTGGGRRPRPKGLGPRLATWFALTLARLAASHRDGMRARRDAAILRQTHAGCATCHGTGTIATRNRKGEWTGSKPCTAKPATVKVNRWQAAKAARLGPDKHSGLYGWRCPCGAGIKRPRFRDAKTATAALRTHERQRHAGTSLGGTWYLQLPEGANPGTDTGKARP